MFKLKPMITDADVKKLEKTFVTKEFLKKELGRFATKDVMERGFVEIIEFIGEIKGEIMAELNKFHDEVVEFRSEMRDINRNSQSTLNNHETRITHLEYVSKQS